jgi:hypothetical protein
MKILTEKDSKKMKNNKPTYKKLQKDNKRLRNVINLYIKSKERTDYLELKWVKNPHGAISLEMDDSLCVDFNPSDEKYWTPNAIWYHQGDNGDGKFSSLEDAKKNAITWYVIDILKGMRVLKALNEQIDEHLIDKIKNDTAIMLEGKIKWLKYELDIQVRSRVDEARKDATYHRKIHEKTQKQLIDLNGLLDDIVETIEEKWHCTLCHGTGKFYKYTCDKEQIVCSWCKGAGVSKEASELIQKIKSMRELVAK